MGEKDFSLFFQVSWCSLALKKSSLVVFKGLFQVLFIHSFKEYCIHVVAEGRGGSLFICCGLTFRSFQTEKSRSEKSSHKMFLWGQHRVLVRGGGGFWHSLQLKGWLTLKYQIILKCVSYQVTNQFISIHLDVEKLKTAY